MFIRSLKNCSEFVAGDGTKLRELFNPLKDKELDLRYSFAHATIAPGNISLAHKLKTSEVYYILKGKGLMYIDGEEKEVSEGDIIYIPPFAEQKIKNIDNIDLEFICIVDPAWKPEDEIILNS
ncbi:MAG: cupin domain-containing protein [Patescibacteria group bacterium]